MKRSTVIINSVLGVAILGTGAFAYVSLRPATAAAPTTTQTATVQLGNVTASVSASGNLSSASQMSVNFQGSSGIVTAIYVKAGDEVTVGQALAKIDDTTAKTAVAQAQAALTSAQYSYTTTASGQTDLAKEKDALTLQQAQMALDNAKANVAATKDSIALSESQLQAKVAAATADRDAAAAAVAAADPALNCAGADKTNTLCTKLASAQATLDTANANLASALLADAQKLASANNQLASQELSFQSTMLTIEGNQAGPTDVQLAQARASLLNAQASLDNAKRTLDQTVLKAPTSGTVTTLNGVVGASSTVSGSGSGSSSTTSGFLVIADLTNLRVISMVAEADVAKLKIDNPATITFSAVGLTAQGKVSNISVQETVSNNVVQYAVTVSLVSPPAGLRLGQTATVSITTGSANGVLTVPSTAVTTVGNRSTVVVRDNGKDTTVQVQVGLSGNNRTEITSGLQQGQVVVLGSGSSTTNTNNLTFPNGGVGGTQVRPR